MKVVCGSLVMPLLVEAVKPEGLAGFLISAGCCVLWSSLVIWLLGLTREERHWVKGMIINRLKKNDKDN